jgi:DNA-binding transcriptional LysR family regulator
MSLILNTKTQRFYYKGNQLKQLRAFCAVAKSGKMTDAAAELFLSQPAISLQVRALERELDTVLFERHGPRINLTREGQELYEMARPLVDGLESLNSRFNRQMKGDLNSGEVIIAAGESTIIYLLPELVAQFRAHYPNIHVQLRNVTGRDGLAMIRDDEVDFAIGSMLDVPSDISYEPAHSFEPALIMPLGHDLADRKRIKNQTGGHRALWFDSPAPSPDNLAHGRPGFPATPGSLQGNPGSGRLGSHQTLC